METINALNCSWIIFYVIVPACIAIDSTIVHIHILWQSPIRKVSGYFMYWIIQVLFIHNVSVVIQTWHCLIQFDIHKPELIHIRVCTPEMTGPLRITGWRQRLQDTGTPRKNHNQIYNLHPHTFKWKCNVNGIWDIVNENYNFNWDYYNGMLVEKQWYHFLFNYKVK